MTPVDQTILDADGGNCFTACLASLLDLPIGEVPNFAAESGDRMHEAAGVWLALRGLRFITMGFAHAETFRNTYFPTGEYCLLCGPSTIPGRGHAVVGWVNADGAIEVAHDPHPGKKGLPDGYRWVRFLVGANADAVLFNGEAVAR